MKIIKIKKIKIKIRKIKKILKKDVIKDAYYINNKSDILYIFYI